MMLISNSADFQTLLFSLMSSVSSILGNGTRYCFLRVGPERRTATVEYCNFTTGRWKNGETIAISSDQYLGLALEQQHMTVFVPGKDEGSMSESAQMFASSGFIFLILREKASPAGILVCRCDAKEKPGHEQNLALEIVALQAGSRMELLSAKKLLNLERRATSVLSSFFSGKDGSYTLLSSYSNPFEHVMSAFPELQGIVYAVHSPDGHVCRAAQFSNGSLADQNMDIDRLVSLLPRSEGVSDVILTDGNAVWTAITEAFGTLPGDSSTCSTVVSPSADSMLLIFHSGQTLDQPVADAAKALLSALDIVEWRSIAFESQKESSVLLEHLLALLEKIKFTSRPPDIVASFASVILSITSANLLAIYRYNEQERSLGLLYTNSHEHFRGPGSIPLYEFNQLFPNSGQEPMFHVHLNESSGRVWNAIGLDESTAEADVLGISGGQPSVMLILTYGRGESHPHLDAAILTRLCRVLSNLVTTSFSLHETLDYSHFSTEFLRVISQSLRSKDGRWSLEIEQVADRICALAGSSMQQDFAFLFSTSKNMSYGPAIGKWARHPYDVSRVHAEVSELMKSFENRDGWMVGGSRRLTLLIDDKKFAGLLDQGVRSATVMLAGDIDGPLSAAMLLLTSQNRSAGASEAQIVSAALEATRLMLESRYRRVDIDWTLNAMRSELAVAKGMSSTFDQLSVLNSTVREVARLLRCDMCLVEVLDERGICRIASLSDRSGALRQLPQVKNSRDSQQEDNRTGFSTLTIETGSNLSVQGEVSCNTLLSSLPVYEQELIASVMGQKAIGSVFGAPISFAGKLLGLLVCIRSNQDSALSKGEISYLESVAALAATSVENSRNMASTLDALAKLRRLDTLRSNFSSIAAHELRTPLTSIRVYIELMKMGKVGKFNEQEFRNIENLLASISELTEIINNMLEFTRMEAMLLETEMSPVSFQPLVEEICALLSAVATAKSISLEHHFDKNIRAVNANAPLIKRVMNNLVGNAIKFTAEGGKISVKVSDDREGVLLTVEDNGKGIPAEDLPYIFDRFHVVDSSILHSRTGFRLGLPISKLIVERHGGRIWADSELGKGSKFYVLLPHKQGISTENWLSDATGYIH